MSSMRMAEYYSNEYDQMQEVRYSYEPGVVTAVLSITVNEEDSEPVTKDYLRFKVDLDEKGRAMQTCMSELKEPDYSSFGDYVAIARFTYDGSGKLVRRDNLENGFYLEYIWDGANMTGAKTVSQDEYERRFFYSECLNDASVDLNEFINPKTEDDWFIRSLGVFGSRTRNVVLPVDPADGQHFPTDPSACSVETDEDGNLVSITYSIDGEKTVMSVYYK